MPLEAVLPTAKVNPAQVSASNEPKIERVAPDTYRATDSSQATRASSR